MKKILRSKPLKFLMILPFFLMFIQINIQKEIQVVGWHAGYSLGGPKNTISILPSGDTVVPGDQEWVTFIGIDSVINVTPVVDNVLLSGELSPGVSAYSVFKNGMRYTRHAEKKVYVVIRKLDEFKKEQFIYASLISAASKKDYFSLMKEVSSEVDNFLSQRKNYATWPDSVQQLYNERRGKPKLRAFLSYLIYLLYGGKDQELAYKLGAISEANDIHLYAHNYLIDGKRCDISENRNCVLVGGGEIIGNEVTRMISELPIPSDQKVIMLSVWASNISRSYMGQFLDSQSLTEDLPEEREFMATYNKRCELLSGSMYAASLWTGSVCAPKSTREDRGLIYRLGYNWGAGLQAINDISDFSLLKPNGFSDLKSLRPTAPVYYLTQQYGLDVGLNKSPQELQKLFVSSGAFEKSMSIVRERKYEIRKLIKMLPEFAERDILRQATSSMKTNRYLQDIKNV